MNIKLNFGCWRAGHPDGSRSSRETLYNASSRFSHRFMTEKEYQEQLERERQLIIYYAKKFFPHLLLPHAFACIVAIMNNPRRSE